MTLDQKELIEKIDNALIPLEPPKKKKRKMRSIYGDQIIFMCTLLVMGGWAYGFRAVAICLMSVICCVLIDMGGCLLTKKQYNFKDMSTVAYGLALGLMLPASVPYYIVIFGDFLAIGVKHIFGGKDNYIFNPTAVSVAFLIICYPAIMLMYPQYGESLPVFGDVTSQLSTGIEGYFIKSGAIPNLSPLDILMGNFSGAIGTTHILVIIVCAVCLMCRRSISAMVTITSVGTMVALSYLFPITTPASDGVVLQLIGGFLLFGFVFLANDPQTLPKSIFGRFLYGLFLGIAVIIFRKFGKVEGIFVFALLLVNALSLYLDRMGVSIISTSKRVFTYLRTSLGSFERFSENAKSGKTPKLTDTQEIVVEATNYNMPPIDNKVTKIKRKKKFSFAEIKQQVLKLIEKKEQESQENNSDEENELNTDTVENSTVEEPVVENSEKAEDDEFDDSDVKIADILPKNKAIKEENNGTK